LRFKKMPMVLVASSSHSQSASSAIISAVLKSSWRSAIAWLLKKSLKGFGGLSSHRLKKLSTVHGCLYSAEMSPTQSHSPLPAPRTVNEPA